MQLWQQNLMYRQLQELQRQQHLQQVDQEAKQQNSPNNFSGVARQAAAEHLPLVVNGMPIYDISKYTLKNERMGGEPKLSSTSQMFTPGNMNCTQSRGTLVMQGFPNGLVMPWNQGQGLGSPGSVPQQRDQSLYGTPVSSNRNFLNQQSQFPGISNSIADMIAIPNDNQIVKQPMRPGIFNTFQSEQCMHPGQLCVQNGLATGQISSGKNLFSQVLSQNTDSGIMLENVPQLNHLGRSVPVQEFQDRQERIDWTANLQEETVPQVGLSQSSSNLDQTEQKLLFGTDNERPWSESSGRIGIISLGHSMHQNLPEGNDYFNAFPSIQSGTWSALMQSAVAENSSSDTGLHDEGSAMTFQQTESSSGKNPIKFIGSETQQATWVHNLRSPSTSTSRPFPLSDIADASTKDSAAGTLFQSYVKSAHDHSQTVDAEVLSSCQLDQNQLNQKVLEGVIQVQMHSRSTSSGARVQQAYELPLSTVPAELKSNQHSLFSSLANQQGMPLHIGNQNNSKMNVWNDGELLSSGRDGILKADDHETTVLRSLRNCPKEDMHMQGYQEGNAWKDDGGQISNSVSHLTGGLSTGTSRSDNPQVQTGNSYLSSSFGVSLKNSIQGMNEKSVHGRQADCGRLVSADSSLESKRNEDVDKYRLQMRKDQVVWGSPVNLFERELGVAYEKETENSSQKEISEGDHISDNSHSTQLNDSGIIWKENSMLVGSDSSQSSSGNKRPSHQIGQKNYGPYRFHFHPMGNVDVDGELHTSKQDFYSKGQPQVLAHGMRSLEGPELNGQLQFGGLYASNNVVDLHKQRLLNSQRDVNAWEEIDRRGRISVYDTDILPSFEESTANLARNNSGQTSPNMLELLHKVDQSSDGSMFFNSGLSNHGRETERRGPNKVSCHKPSYFQYNQPSALQGDGVALPLRHQLILDHPLSSQAVHNYSPGHFDLGVEGDKTQMCLTSSVSISTLSPLHEISEREHWNPRSNLSVIQNEKPSQSGVQVFSPATSASRLPYSRNQVQQQLQQQQQWQQQEQIKIASEYDQSVNMHCGNEFHQDAKIKSPLHIRQLNNLHSGALHGEAVVDPAGQQSFSGVKGIHPFKFAGSSDGHSPLLPYTCSSDSGQLQVIGTTSFPRSSSQLPGLERQSVSQPSMTPMMHKQGAFSAMLHNVWNNVPMQRHLYGNPPGNMRSNLFQPINANSSDTKFLASQRSDDQGAQTDSKFATCSIDSKKFTYEEQHAVKGCSLQQIPLQKVDVSPHTYGIPQVQESILPHASRGSSSIPIPSIAESHQQDIGGSLPGQGSSINKHTSHGSPLNISSSSHQIGALGLNLKLSDLPNRSFSLLQQLQAMKPMEAIPSKQSGKRLREGDSGAYAQQMAENMPQNIIYEYNTSKVPLDNELCATGHQSSLLSDSKMLCFSLESNENQNMIRTSQPPGSDVHPQDLTSAGFNSLQKYSSLKTSVSSSVGVAQAKQIDLQIAPSWLEYYGKLRNGEDSPMYNGLDGVQKTTGLQHYLLSKISGSMRIPCAIEQRNDSSQVASIWHSNSTIEQSSSLHYAPVDDVDHNLVPRPKKHKTASFELLPWCKEITKRPDQLWNCSMAELGWAQATKRLNEKVEEEAQLNVGGSTVPRARRRLIFTTRLMQELFPALPIKILTADATLEHESVVYLVARLALGDACGRISCSRNDFLVPSVSKNTIPEKFKNTEVVDGHPLPELVKDFIGRVRKLEDNLSRSERSASVLDIKFECQDLERCSIMNRFARFHVRNQAEGVGGSSSSDAATPQLFPQRYVTALSMPVNPPERVACVSL